jgi:hypothetical protein
MANRSRGEIPKPVRELRGKIEVWRRSRVGRGRMPEALWSRAASLAREHGVWWVSRSLGVNYQSLKRRVDAAEGEVIEPSRAAGGSESVSFVELDAEQFLGRGLGETALVELVASDGARLTVRLAGERNLDVETLAAGFWSRDR